MRVPTVERFGQLVALQRKIGREWRSIEKAIGNTEDELRSLEKLLLPADGRPIAENVSIVFFGSTARGESTKKSDLDWTLLVNGEVDAQHTLIYQEIRRKLRDAGKIEPGATGTFGGLAFSHELVHCIGGQDDTNRNLTLRMLLLLESLSIGDDEPRHMVIRAVLQRYLADDPSWTWKPDGKLPRFLLNDIIRYWRTMAVDFADKFHDQEGDKWALRNAKLRFSRKLILLSGMLACFSWQLRGIGPSTERDDQAVGKAISHFEAYFSRPPLEVLADELLLTEAPPELCVKIFAAYDGFLATLDTPASRDELEKIPRDLADKSAAFQQIREQSHDFRDALLEWLYAPGTRLYQLVKEYALF